MYFHSIFCIISITTVTYTIFMFICYNIFILFILWVPCRQLFFATPESNTVPSTCEGSKNLYWMSRGSNPSWLALFCQHKPMWYMTIVLPGEKPWSLRVPWVVWMKHSNIHETHRTNLLHHPTHPCQSGDVDSRKAKLISHCIYLITWDGQVQTIQKISFYFISFRSSQY
jgi:hypothetical protein